VVLLLQHTAEGTELVSPNPSSPSLLPLLPRMRTQVILDVVFNHTAEGNQLGPTLSFRGLDNRVYYMLAPLGEYYNYRYGSAVAS
jgi:isoamylase